MTSTISKAYNEEIELRKWCIDQAMRISRYNENGYLEQVDTVAEAQKIYDWVTK